MPPRRGWGMGWRGWLQDFAPDGAANRRAEATINNADFHQFDNGFDNGIAFQKGKSQFGQQSNL